MIDLLNKVHIRRKRYYIVPDVFFYHYNGCFRNTCSQRKFIMIFYVVESNIYHFFFYLSSIVVVTKNNQSFLHSGWTIQFMRLQGEATFSSLEFNSNANEGTDCYSFNSYSRKNQILVQSLQAGHQVEPPLDP